MRSNATQRNHWAQFRICAFALLLPPLTLGAAFYSMLAAPDDPAAHSGRAQTARGESQHDPAQSRGSTEDTARVSNPVPIVVTAGTSAAANPPPANAEPALAGSAVGAPGPAPSLAATAELSTSLLPRPLSLPGQPPQPIQPARMVTTQTPATQTPALQTPAVQAPVATDLPRAEGSPAASSAPTRPVGPSNHRNAQRHRQNEFSLKNLLEQLGIVQRHSRS
jgi:transcription termination factor Rho